MYVPRHTEQECITDKNQEGQEREALTQIIALGIFPKLDMIYMTFRTSPSFIHFVVINEQIAVCALTTSLLAWNPNVYSNTIQNKSY